jgi:D-serine deaminase-like pyridoxal phosphate-dependent protein
MQAVTKDAPKASEHTDADLRIAPDPFSVVMPALAALGAIASIAAIGWVGQERTPDRTRGRRKAHMALKDLESCAMGLADVFRRMQRHPRLFIGEGASASSPMKFGIHRGRVDAEAARVYQQLASDVASKLVLACHNSFEAMSAIEDGEIEAPEQVFYGFGEQQERLNQLIQNRATLKVTLAGGIEIADRLTALVRELKQYRTE